jgi:hypothetical protein
VHGFNDIRAGKAQHFIAALERFSAKVGWAEVEILYESSESAIENDDSVVDCIEVGLTIHDSFTILAIESMEWLA